MATGRGAGFGVLLPVRRELAYVVSPPPLNASQGLPLGASMTLRSWPPRPICRTECSVDESPCSLAAQAALLFACEGPHVELGLEAHRGGAAAGPRAAFDLMRESAWRRCSRDGVEGAAFTSP